MGAFMTSILTGRSPAQIAALPLSAIASLTRADVALLTLAQVSALTSLQLNALSASAFGSLTATQIGALNAGAFGGLNASHLSLLTVAQAKGLSAAEVGGLSVSLFDAYIAPYLASLATNAMAGLSLAQLRSLSPAQIETLSAAQLSALLPAQTALLQANNPVLADAARFEVNGSLSYSSLLQVLNDAAVGGMNALKFSGLRALASELNVAGGIRTSAYAQQIFDDVVYGNSANATWRGGSAKAVALGNLTASSSQTQVNELIGKWFLGTDLPSTVVPGMAGTYQAVTAPLFSAGGPALTDINQGDVGDCYFLAALAETALQDPTLIQNMIQANSNGTYSVQFWVNGQADYVTVNNALPTMPGGYHYGDGSHFEFDHGASAGAANDWSALIEKAYVELEAQLNVTPGSDGHHGNAYADIAGGWSNGLSAITGQSADTYSLFAGESPLALGAVLANLQTAFGAHEDLLMATAGNDTANNLVGGHMYAVTGINLAAGTVSLDNPWNGSGVGTGLKMQFTDSIATLARDGVTFFAATGPAPMA
jgi:hypothetical protein